MKKLIAAVFAAEFCVGAQAVEYIWTGAEDTAWANAANWEVTAGTAPENEADRYPQPGDAEAFDIAKFTSAPSSFPTIPTVPEGKVLEIYRGCNLSISQGIQIYGTLRLTGPGSFANGHGGASVNRLEVYGESPDGGKTESGSLIFSDWYGFGQHSTIYVDSTTGPRMKFPGANPKPCVPEIKFQVKATATNGNGAFEVTSNGNVTFNCDIDTSYVSAGKLYLTGNGAANVYTFNGEIIGGQYSFFEYGTFHFMKPVKLNTYYSGSGTHVYFHDVLRCSNFVPIGNTHFCTNDVYQLLNGVSAMSGFSIYSQMTMDLGGYDQHLPKVPSSGLSMASTSTLTSENPALLHFRQFNLSQPGVMYLGGYITGKAGIVWAPVPAAHEIAFTNRVKTTAGDLIVSNGIASVSKGSGFSGLGRLEIGGSAAVEFRADATRESFASQLVVAEGGTLTLADGIRLVVKTLSYGGGASPADGTYKAGDEGFGFLAGAGELVVRSYDVTPNAWKGGTGAWNDPEMWSQERVPDVHDAITIDGSSSIVTVPDDNIGSVETLTLSGGAKLVFTGWNTPVAADEINITGSSTVTASGPFTNDNAKTRVYFRCRDFTLGAQAKIDLDGLGWKGGYIDLARADKNGNPPMADAVRNERGHQRGGFGPGGADVRMGGCHYAYGAYCRATRTGRFHSYDDPTAPVEPGSGGFAVGVSKYGVAGSAKNGIGSGGGAVFIDATGIVTINGTISADGCKATVNAYYVNCLHSDESNTAGAGGSVRILSERIGGTGMITARGGNGNCGVDKTAEPEYGVDGDNVGYAGAGGCIAVSVAAAKQEVGRASGLRLNAGGGLYVRALDSSSVQYGVDLHYSDVDRSFRNAEPGTLYLSDVKLIDDMIGKGLTGRLFGISEYTYQGDLEWTDGYVRFGETGAVFNVTGDLTMSGANSRIDIGGNHIVTNWTRCVYLTAGDEPVALNVGGDCSLAGGAALYVFAAEVPGETAWGGTVAIGGSFSVGAGSLIVPTSDFGYGGAPHFTVGGAFTLAEGAKVDGCARGGSGGWCTAAYSPTRSLGVGVGAGSGGASAGNGGAGAHSYNGDTAKGTAGRAVSDVYRPVNSGSGGGSGGYGAGGDGGGIFHLIAGGQVTIDGSINVDGSTSGYSGTGYVDYFGNGSGGTICIYGTNFVGAATANLSAKGGNSLFGKAGVTCATGGGGCVALWCGPVYTYESGFRDVHATASDDASLQGGFAQWYGTIDASAGVQVLKTESAQPDERALGGIGSITFNRTFPLPGLMLLVR